MKIFIIIISIILIGLTTRFVIPFEPNDDSAKSAKQRGVCWVGGHNQITSKELEPLVERHVSWISQTPFAWQGDPTSPQIRMNIHEDKVWWGESDLGISETTQMAKKLGVETLLKPHLWVRNSWPGEVKMSDQKSWHEWFQDYQTFILHYASLAEKNKIEIFCIGTELQHSIEYDSEWRQLIKKIRLVYHGKLTYAANFNEEFKKVKFWDDLDFIGIQAYFPLSKGADPKTEELMLNWIEPIKAIEEIHKKFNKPVLFTEIGYKSTSDAAIEPWSWPQQNKEAKVSSETQAKCYDAFFKAVWNKKWLAGAYFWKWYPFGPGRLGEIDFTPQGKLAEQILVENFRNER